MKKAKDKEKNKEKENVKKLTGKTKRNVSYRNSAKGLLNDFKETFKAFQTDDVGVNNINIEEIEDLKEGIEETKKLEKEYYGIVDTKKEVKFGIDKTSAINMNGKEKNNKKNNAVKEDKKKNKKEEEKEKETKKLEEKTKQEKNKENKTSFLDKLTNKKGKVKSTNEIFNKKVEDKRQENKNKKENSLDEMLKKLEENEKKNEEMQKKIMNSEDDIDNI